MYGFKRKINWNKCLAETADQVKNRFLDFLIDPSFQGLNRLFVLSFKDDDSQENHEQYHLSTVEIKDLKKKLQINSNRFKAKKQKKQFYIFVKEQLKYHDFILL